MSIAIIRNASFIKIVALWCLVCCPILAAQIETFYGTLPVEEPVLLELIDSPAFQRLKHIHQYGIAYYTTHPEEFTRYEHSLGVFALLRVKGCSLEEQIAGLLHDVSHTVFSHSGDSIFNRQDQEIDYQNLTHSDYLERSGLGTILRKYGYSVEEIQPTEEHFPALEKPLPKLCADRLDYNLQGAFHQGFMTYEEAMKLFHEIQWIGGEWISQDHALLKKLVRYSLFMTQDCWGSPTTYVLSLWLAEAILRGFEIELMSLEDIRFGQDQEIWNRLVGSRDPLIQKNMHMILHAADYHRVVSSEGADLLITTKFRGIDPFVVRDGKRLRLTVTDPLLAEEFQSVKGRMAQGWSIKFTSGYKNL